VLLPAAAAAAVDVLLLLLRDGLAIRDRLDGGTREGEPSRLPPPRAANLLVLDASVLCEESAVRFLPFDGDAVTAAALLLTEGAAAAAAAALLTEANGSRTAAAAEGCGAAAAATGGCSAFFEACFASSCGTCWYLHFSL